jgi:hypothetical protein
MKQPTNRLIEAPAENGEGAIPTNEPIALNRLQLGGNYYAERAEHQIRIFNPEGLQLFALNPEMIAFEPKPLGVAVELYMMAYNQGDRNGYERCKKKVEDVLKLCI